jgi:pimeloyl-ACP methyl ester carboxylesterase
MRAILPFSGFTETRQRARGIEDLWGKILLKASGPDVIVYSPETWRQDPRPILGELRRLGVRDLMLIGYSWGAGVGCMRTAKLAREYGVIIRVACLCDPVYRSPWVPSWIPFNPLSLTRIPTIKIPASVQKVAWVRQRQNIPAGHNLQAEDPIHTKILDPLVLDTTHSRIDEHPHWLALVQRELQVFLLS